MSLYDNKSSSTERSGVGVFDRFALPQWLVIFGAYLILMSAWGHLSALQWWISVGGLAEPIPSMEMLSKHSIGLISIIVIITYSLTKNAVCLYYIVATSLASIAWIVLGLASFGVPEAVGRFLYIFQSSIQALPWFTLTQFYHFYDSNIWTIHAVKIADMVVCALFSGALFYFHKKPGYSKAT